MKRSSALVLALFSSALIVGAYAQAPSAQPNSENSEVEDACAPDRDDIEAADLIRAEGEDAEERILDPERCPLGGRPIVDNGIGVELPRPGEGTHAEILTTTGAQELKVTRLEDGTAKIEHVGAEDPSAPDPTSYAPHDDGLDTAKNSPSACRDDAYLLKGEKVYSTLDFRFNQASTPSNLTRAEAEDAIVKAGKTIVVQRNDCGFRDKVSTAIQYLGDTGAEANAYGQNGNLYCGPYDGSSVVSFNELLPGILALECTNTVTNPAGGYASIVESDIGINKVDHRWTTNGDSSSCTNEFDLQGVMTHERGHSFGLGHVSEYNHGKLTMSEEIKPCSVSERTLGLGDMLGLRALY